MVIGASRTFYRLVKTDPPAATDFLSQAALRKPPPRTDPGFLREWEGLSLFDTYAGARKVGLGRRWRIGEYIAELHLPDGAPITLEGPSRTGHWLLYDANGACPGETEADFLLGCVVRVMNGPTTEA